MRRQWIVPAVASLISLWLFSGIAYADEFKGKSETRTAGNVQVEFITQADGTVVGENNIAVQLKDAATGQPIIRDSVRVELTVGEGDHSSTKHGDASEHQSAVVNLKASHDVAGKYSGKVSFPTAGDWKARVILDAGGAQRSVTFGIRVDGDGPDWLIIGGFVGILMAIVGTAAVMKPKALGGAPRTVEAAQS